MRVRNETIMWPKDIDTVLVYDEEVLPKEPEYSKTTQSKHSPLQI